MTEHHKQFSTILKRMRREKKMSQTEAATLTGTSKMHIYRLEKAGTGASIDDLEKLVNAYGYSIRITFVKHYLYQPKKVFWADDPIHDKPAPPPPPKLIPGEPVIEKAKWKS